MVTQTMTYLDDCQNRRPMRASELESQLESRLESARARAYVCISRYPERIVEKYGKLDRIRELSDAVSTFGRLHYAWITAFDKALK